MGNVEDKADEQPYVVELKPGNQYKICTCGASKRMPFCDDSHRDLPRKNTTKTLRSIKIIPSRYVALVINSDNYRT